MKISKTEDDNFYIEQIKNDKNVDECVSVLYKRYANVYYKIIHNFFQKQNSDKKLEFIQECYYHIFFAAKEYNYEKKTKFSSYLGNKARWLCLNYFNRKSKHLSLIANHSTEDDSISENKIIEDLCKQENFKNIKNAIKSDPDHRIEKIFNLRYFEGKKNKLMPWKNISSHLNMSVQGCINLHNNFIQKIKNKTELTK